MPSTLSLGGGGHGRRHVLSKPPFDGVRLDTDDMGLNFEILALESPAQRKAREDCEAMGLYWGWMTPTTKNPQAYTDFIAAQIKVSMQVIGRLFSC